MGANYSSPQTLADHNSAVFRVNDNLVRLFYVLDRTPMDLVHNNRYPWKCACVICRREKIAKLQRKIDTAEAVRDAYVQGFEA